ncbi:hypothetical protein K501DRAFT_334938 [Backusella circina FSU 941]|nr:hypothetical protein K501DRAFT_334938 [Backusella circina FSU 941]
MTKFHAESLMADIVIDLAELNDLLFDHTQQSLERESATFVEHFENLPVDSLARTYANLTKCNSQLTIAKNSNFEETKDKAIQTQAILNKLLEKNTIQVNDRFEQEKQAFLQEQNKKQKQIQLEMQRESDKMDEIYTKKTRDSIRRNLVGGSNQWY